MKNTSPLYENKLKNYFIVHEHSSLQFPLHVHPYIEIVHVLEGIVEMQIDTNIYQLEKGDLVIIFPNIKHNYHTISDDIHTNLAIYNCELHILPLHKNILLGHHPTTPVIHSEHIHPDIDWVEQRFVNVNPTKDNVIFVGSLFSMILCHAYPFLHLTPNEDETTHDIVEKVMAYVSKHCSENISLSSLSAEFGISKFKLSRIFSNTLKTSFPDYVNIHRINYAEYLLTNTDKDITTITYECGYNNQQSFNRAFKKYRGITPSDYKKKLTRDDHTNNIVPHLPNGIFINPSIENSLIQPVFISG